MTSGRKKGTAKTGGRRKGTPNKVTVAIREAALAFGPDAIAELARLMHDGQTEHVRIAACREILDRAYGKARQSVEHTGRDNGPIEVRALPDREKMRRLACFLLEDKAITISDGTMQIADNLEPNADLPKPANQIATS